MNYLFDTNIIIHLIKHDPRIQELEARMAPDPNALRVISIVTHGEMESLAVQFGWGSKKVEALRELLRQYLIIPIDSNQIVNTYAEIDAFSQGKHPTKKSGTTSRNMGKNDLWIAATAVVTNSILVTSDGDFDHLTNAFLTSWKI